jgi:hypothetical protein
MAKGEHIARLRQGSVNVLARARHDIASGAVCVYVGVRTWISERQVGEGIRQTGQRVMARLRSRPSGSNGAKSGVIPSSLLDSQATHRCGSGLRVLAGGHQGPACTGRVRRLKLTTHYGYSFAIQLCCSTDVCYLTVKYPKSMRWTKIIRRRPYTEKPALLRCPKNVCSARAHSYAQTLQVRYRGQ